MRVPKINPLTVVEMPPDDRIRQAIRDRLDFYMELLPPVERGRINAVANIHRGVLQRLLDQGRFCVNDVLQAFPNHEESVWVAVVEALGLCEGESLRAA